MNRKLLKVFAWSAAGLVALMLFVAVAGFVAGYMGAHEAASTGVKPSTDRAMLWVMTPFAVLAMAGGFLMSVAWMRSIDEAAREAHKAAWYWGGSAGMSVGLTVVILAALLPQAENLALPSWFENRTDPAAYMATGAFAILLLMVAGYTLVWAWWWLARSRG